MDTSPSMNENENIRDPKIDIVKAIMSRVTGGSFHAYNHIGGTTQTTTNDLDATGTLQNGKEVERTTRLYHSQQVAMAAEDIARACGYARGSYEVSMASLIAVCHDIGHCIYGHDGEAAFNNFLYYDHAGISDAQKQALHAKRIKYLGADYEAQMDKQWCIAGWSTAHDKMGFDHGEESAFAIQELLETDKALQELASTYPEAFAEVSRQLVQGIACHSKPAFRTDMSVSTTVDPDTGKITYGEPQSTGVQNIGSQAVCLADSIAYMVDDARQFMAFDKLDRKQFMNQLRENDLFLDTDGIVRHRSELKEGEEPPVVGDDVEIQWDDIQNACVVEVGKHHAKYGTIRNGSHLRDVNWLFKTIADDPSPVLDEKNIDGIKTRLTDVVKSYLSPEDSELASSLLGVINSISIGKDIHAQDRTVASYVFGGATDDKGLQDLVNKYFAATYPRNFAANEMHKAVSEMVIFKNTQEASMDTVERGISWDYKQKKYVSDKVDTVQTQATGNQQARDMGAVKLTLQVLEAELKAVGVDPYSVDYGAFVEGFGKTNTFLQLKSIISDMAQEKVAFMGLSYHFDESQKQLLADTSPGVGVELVLDSLGIKPCGVLQACTAIELVTKVMQRQTNEMHRMLEERVVTSVLGINNDDLAKLGIDVQAYYDVAQHSARLAVREEKGTEADLSEGQLGRVAEGVEGQVKDGDYTVEEVAKLRRKGVERQAQSNYVGDVARDNMEEARARIKSTLSANIATDLNLPEDATPQQVAASIAQHKDYSQIFVSTLNMQEGMDDVTVENLEGILQGYMTEGEKPLDSLLEGLSHTKSKKEGEHIFYKTFVDQYKDYIAKSILARNNMEANLLQVNPEVLKAIESNPYIKAQCEKVIAPTLAVHRANEEKAVLEAAAKKRAEEARIATEKEEDVMET